MSSFSTPTFDRMACRVKDLKVTTEKKGERTKVGSVEIDGRRLIPTQRFFTSLYAKYGFGESIFKWFDHMEVFARISERAPNDKLVVTVESRRDSDNTDSMRDDTLETGTAPGDRLNERLLACSAPTTIRVDHTELLDLLSKNGVDTTTVDYGNRYRRAGNRPSLPMNLLSNGFQNRDLITSSAGDGGAMTPPPGTRPDVPDVSYDTGIIRSIHQPRNGGAFSIAGDEFSNRFVMDTPVDGYGKPSIYLMLLRQVCTNGAIGYARAFRSELSLGKSEDSFEYALTRAFEGFNNEEGFTALRQRYESAANSWASISDINKIYKILVRLHHSAAVRVNVKYLTESKSGADGSLLLEGSPIIQSYHKLCGDLTQTYGLANLDALGVKRQRTLPAGCTVFELLNFITEVATHHATPAGSRTLQAATGDFLSAEYDLEGTYAKFPNWKDFLLTNKAAADTFAITQGGKV